MIPNFAFALQHVAEEAVERGAPHFRGDFPPFQSWICKISSDDDVAIVTMQFRAAGMPVLRKLEPDEFAALKRLAGEQRSVGELRNIPGLDPLFGWDRFVLVLDVTGDVVDWGVAEREVIAWLNGAPLERAQLMNIDRVRSAIPAPPQYSLSRVQASMWVLECDETFVQGTAFDLDPYGVVINDHVVHGATAMVAFRTQIPSVRHAVRVIKQNKALDLAILEIVQGARPNPLSADFGEVPHMAHVAVCGFPNYRLGDSGVLTPGLIIGTRPRSSILRMLTNAPIVAGMSGGPALGGSGNVIGICTTGSRFIQDASTTEDHSIIPVSALDVLLGS